MDAFREHWRDHFEPATAGPIVLAVSGGIDSMALMRLLVREGIAGEGVDVVAAHYDHGTRGDESEEDGRFVAAVAERWGAACRRGSGDAPARAARTGRSPQAAARELRYGFLRAVSGEIGASAIVTAHHRDDRVETVLLRLVHGTSVDGLGALRPIEERDGALLLRPLLPFSREAIAGWAEATGVPYREDPSNRSPRYPRTRVREEVLPLLRELNPRVDAALVRLAARAASDAAYLGEVAGEVLDEATERREERRWRLRAEALIDLPDPVLSRVVLAGWAWGAPPHARSPGAEWVENALEFLRGGRGGTVECPGGGELRRAGPHVEFHRSPDTDREARHA
ncbi:MAG: tRNA lysidine(34) synthetase TilS [Gemmatimonadota bacterium]|nr:tRNA lysidine(34) synthetase TilS [Gemmatimonadota bacterium]